MPARSSSYYSAATRTSRSRTRVDSRSPYSSYSRGRTRSRTRSRGRYRSRTHSRGGYRSRTRSRTRSRGRYSEYSDSFEDDRSRRRSPLRKPKAKAASNVKPKPKTNQFMVLRKPGPYAKKFGIKKPKGGAATTTPRPQLADVVTKRMLSARRLKINELKNEIDTLVKELEIIRKENKVLKRDNVIQNKQLDKFQDREGELPHLIDSHNHEVSALKEQLRKWKDRNDKANKSLRKTEEQLSNTKSTIRKLQGLAEDKKLQERDELSRRLQQAERDLEDRTHRVEQLERHIENLEKTHGRQLQTEMRKHNETKNMLDRLRSDYELTKIHLEDRTKELDARNIYASRINRAKRAGSVTSLPALEPPQRYAPPAKSPEISPRQRAHQFEQHKRANAKKKPEKPQTIIESPRKENKVALSDQEPSQQVSNLKTSHHKKPSQRESTKTKSYGADTMESPRKSTEAAKTSSKTPTIDRDDSWAHIMATQQKISKPVKGTPRDSLDSPPRSYRENGTQEKREREDKVREERELQLRLEREEKKRQAAAEKERFELEQLRLRQEAGERRRKEEEKLEREKFLEQQRIQEAEERAARAREVERQRLERDKDAVAERQRKDLLLQKMKELDGNNDRSDIFKASGDTGFGSTSKANNKGDNQSGGFDSGDDFLFGTKSQPKEYSFRRTDENLYRGLPSTKTGFNGTAVDKQAKSRALLFDDSESSTKTQTTAKNSKQSKLEDIFASNKDEDLDFGGYNPSSFGSSASKPQNKKAVGGGKPSFLDDLGGKSKPSNNSSTIFDNEDIFAANTKAKPVTRTDRSPGGGFPWEANTTTARTDDKMLPLRPRVQNTNVTHNKPTVRAIDSFNDDDLEEVVL